MKTYDAVVLIRPTRWRFRAFSARPRFRASALKCSIHLLIVPSSWRLMQVSSEAGVTSAQAREGWLRDDGLEESGNELLEHAPSAGPGQAAASTGGESSSSSTTGSSKRIMRRWAST
jgi:hypothetical protein